MVQIDYAAKAKNIHLRISPKLEWISGKWFDNKIEIKNIDSWLLGNGHAKNMNQLKELKHAFIALYGRNEDDWYELPIIAEARELIEQGKVDKQMVFPLNDKQLKLINYLLRHDEECFVIITGVGGSGKSTFGNIIKQIFENDVANCDLSQLSGFESATIADKRLVYSEELNCEKMNNGRLKAYFSNQVVTFNPKGQAPFTARCQSAFCFCCNNPPLIDLEDTGLMRRIVYYSMNKKIERPDKGLQRKKYGHDDLVNIVANALMADMDNWKDDFVQDTRYNLLKNNNVFKLDNLNTYEDYKYNATLKGYRPYSESSWYSIKALIKEWREDEYGLCCETRNDR